MKINKLTYIDLFSGCGGLSEGFNMTNKFEGLAHVEWEIPMVNTLRNRLEKKWKHGPFESYKKVIHFDIQRTKELIEGKWSEKSINEFGKSNDLSVIKSGLRGLVGKNKVDVIIGGPPCQAYSIAGRAQDKNSMKDDYRNYLFESFVEVVNEFNPSIFVFENVPGLLSACPGGKLVTDRIYKAFDDIGYSIRKPNEIKKAVYTASELGVPQKRNRVIIIGVKKNANINLEEVYSEIDKLKNKLTLRTVKDAISGLPALKPLNIPLKEKGKNVSHKQVSKLIKKHHEARFHNTRDIKIFKEWLQGNYNKKTSEEKIMFYNRIIGKNSNHAKYRNLEWDKPSPTIVAHLYKDGLMFIHPDINQARSITVKEASLLQSFPDDYEFLGSQGYQYKMIGNAVPPEMAKHIANAIIKVLK
jgi:DNA (cytosine-5)-methyltransferase 1